MDVVREKEQLLSIKVMRLTKPSFVSNIPILCESRDLPGNVSSECKPADFYSSRGAVSGLPGFTMGEILTLPQNFGSIYLGETFSCFVSVHNDSLQNSQDIHVKTDLQTSSQRLTLSGGSTPPSPNLAPGACIDQVIHHEVKELGTHILVCAVSYTSPSGETLSFRKFYKFQVLKPLDVKTKFYNAEDHVSDEVYLEAQIQNITQSPMCMEKVALEPTADYMVEELNSTQTEATSKKLIFGDFTYLNPMDTRQYLYCLKAKTQAGADRPSLIKGVSSIGKLDIVWKTTLGEKGRLQTSQLQRMAPGYGDLKLSIAQIPDSVPLEKPFQLTCRVTSCCERTMDLKLILNNTTGVVWLGISGKQLGKLGPNTSMDIKLQLIPTIPGLQSISGMRLIDLYLKRTYEHDDIAQVFVYTEQDGPVKNI
ncbi:trafficking protein particle complex subunit 13 isoform X2 [Strongylocentrotus purpuratus]|uniref:Trafficking protein particle complex subunit 13 n=1 Tax=Strongylocentrotus purpuratus TaxID=7668 RepID=A0A7M7T3W2_STRPU|nr:trafficking protein particle complex subunit 13 isoform X2 [Strongylocentrotus purpuratus]